MKIKKILYLFTLILSLNSIVFCSNADLKHTKELQATTIDQSPEQISFSSLLKAQPIEAGMTSHSDPVKDVEEKLRLEQLEYLIREANQKLELVLVKVTPEDFKSIMKEAKALIQKFIDFFDRNETFKKYSSDIAKILTLNNQIDLHMKKLDEGKPDTQDAQKALTVTANAAFNASDDALALAIEIAEKGVEELKVTWAIRKKEKLEKKDTSYYQKKYPALSALIIENKPFFALYIQNRQNALKLLEKYKKNKRDAGIFIVDLPEQYSIYTESAQLIREENDL